MLEPCFVVVGYTGSIVAVEVLWNSRGSAARCIRGASIDIALRGRARLSRFRRVGSIIGTVFVENNTIPSLLQTVAVLPLPGFLTVFVFNMRALFDVIYQLRAITEHRHNVGGVIGKLYVAHMKVVGVFALKFISRSIKKTVSPALLGFDSVCGRIQRISEVIGCPIIKLNVRHSARLISRADTHVVVNRALRRINMLELRHRRRLTAQRTW